MGTQSIFGKSVRRFLNRNWWIAPDQNPVPPVIISYHFLQPTKTPRKHSGTLVFAGETAVFRTPRALRQMDGKSRRKSARASADRRKGRDTAARWRSAEGSFANA